MSGLIEGNTEFFTWNILNLYIKYIVHKIQIQVSNFSILYLIILMLTVYFSFKKIFSAKKSHQVLKMHQILRDFYKNLNFWNL